MPVVSDNAGWYCSEGYHPIGLTDEEASGLPQKKVDRIDGNDANYLNKCHPE